MTDATTYTIPDAAPTVDFGGFIEWGRNPPEDRAEKRELFMTKDPESQIGYIWSWDANCWMMFAAVPPGYSPTDRQRLLDTIDRLSSENDALKTANHRLQKEVDHWKANHNERVQAARVLIERVDMPLERVGAYRQYLSALTRVAHLEDELRAERDKRIVGTSHEVLMLRMRAEEMAVRLRDRFYPEATDFEVLDTIDGILQQIEHMTTGLSRLEDEATAVLAVFPESREAKLFPYEPDNDYPPYQLAKVVELLYKKRRR
jgi:hypothetical protein